MSEVEIGQDSIVWRSESPVATEVNEEVVLMNLERDRCYGLGSTGSAIWHKLRKPIQAHGETLSEITFREPTGADIEIVGMPVNIDFSIEPFRIEFDSRRMSAMMVQLAAVPPSTIRTMHPSDWSTCAWGIANFFLPNWGAIG